MNLYIASGVIASCILSSGCVYLGHRARDFSDIVTLSAETKKISCVVRWGCPFGISVAQGRGYGLREGYMGSYEYTERVFFMPPYGGAFELDFTPANNYRKKGYLIRSLCPDDEFWSQSLSFQASIGVYYGVRAGLNMNEALDFVLGWTTLDIMRDDRLATTNAVHITTAKNTTTSFPQLETSAPPAELE